MPTLALPALPALPAGPLPLPQAGEGLFRAPSPACGRGSG
jgi:hypothetical protein